jgi:hypothetical protein
VAQATRGWSEEDHNALSQHSLGKALLKETTGVYTPYGKLIETQTLLGEDGETHDWEFCNPLLDQ